MERDINDSLFKKITSHDHKFLNKTSGVAHTVREFEGVRDFLHLRVWLHLLIFHLCSYFCLLFIQLQDH